MEASVFRFSVSETSLAKKTPSLFSEVR